MSKNVFSGMAGDSDDEFEAKPLNKTQKKKEEKKVSEINKTVQVKPVKVNEAKMAEGGFEVTGGQSRQGARPQTGRGRGQAAGRGRGERKGVTRVGEQGETVFEADKKQGGRFQGKPRDAHPYDRQSGAGRGTRKPDEKKGGHGRGNWGDKPDRAHKRG